MKMHARVLALGLVLVACDGGEEPGPDAGGGGNMDGGGGGNMDGGGGGNVTCTVTATISAMMAAKTVTAVGKAECSASATVEVETCVQWNPSGTFVDIQCMSSTSTAATVQQDNLASCGITPGRRFRARVNATVNGAAKPEVLSADIACF